MAKKAATRKAPAKKGAASLSAQTRICVLHGPEAVLKRERLEELRGALAEAYGEVETLTFDGETARLADVLDELRGYGLMQQHKLVIVDGADTFVSTHREALERYAQNPVAHATLVLRSVKWNKGNLDKHIEKVGCLIKCEAPNDAEAARWLMARAETVHGCKIPPRTAGLLIDRLGKDLGRLDAEVGKLAVMAGPGEAISEKMVEEAVGKGSDEQAWAVQEAFLRQIATGGGQRETGQAIAKLRELIDLAGQAEVLVAYFVADIVRKLYLARRMQRRRVSQGEIVSEFRLFGYERQKLFFAALGKLDDAATGRLFDAIMRRNVRSRSSLGDGVTNLEGFAAELTDVVSGGR